MTGAPLARSIPPRAGKPYGWVGVSPRRGQSPPAPPVALAGYAVGVDAVLEQVLTASPKRVPVYQPNTLAPRRLTPSQTRRMLIGCRVSEEPMIVTSRLQGADMILRTLEYLGGLSKPSVPTPGRPSKRSS